MPDPHKTTPAKVPPDDAPDQMVISDPQFCAMANISADTLRRLDQRGEGPGRVQLSLRRQGRVLGDARKWIRQRTNRPGSETSHGAEAL